MESVFGIAVFTVGLGLFVFPAPIAESLHGRFGTAIDHVTIAIRLLAIVAMALGFSFVLWPPSG